MVILLKNLSSEPQFVIVDLIEIEFMFLHHKPMIWMER